jgi:N-acetylneuraminic acid mutarotase
VFPSFPYRLVPFLAVAVVSCSDVATDPDRSVPGQPSSELETSTSNRWIRRANLPSVERYGPAVAVVPNAAGESILYVIGGATITGASRSKVQAYNASTDTWSYRASLPVPLYASNGAGVIQGKIYVTGGLSGDKAYADFFVFQYDPVKNVWSYKHPMPNTSYNGTTGVIGNRLYVFTGCDQEDCTFYEREAFYRYDPAADQWATLPLPIPGSLTRRAAGVIGGKFYLVGPNGEIWVYDPGTNAWTVKTAVNPPSLVSKAVVVQSKLYGIGPAERNLDGSLNPNPLSVYDPTTNTWTRRKSMPTGRSGFSVARVFVGGAPRIEVVGGPRAGSNIQYIP